MALEEVRNKIECIGDLYDLRNFGCEFYPADEIGLVISAVVTDPCFEYSYKTSNDVLRLKLAAGLIVLCDAQGYGQVVPGCIYFHQKNKKYPVGHPQTLAKMMTFVAHNITTGREPKAIKKGGPKTILTPEDSNYIAAISDIFPFLHNSAFGRTDSIKLNPIVGDVSALFTSEGCYFHRA